MDTSWIFDKLIQQNGQTVTITKHSFVVDDNGQVTDESFTSTQGVYAWILSFAGWRELWDLPGYMVTGDYSACFESTISLDNTDYVTLADGTQTKVKEIIKHFEFNNTNYFEVILNKVSGE